jgi:hypothetical protein
MVGMVWITGASLQGSEPLQISKYISDLCYMLDI